MFQKTCLTKKFLLVNIISSTFYFSQMAKVKSLFEKLDQFESEAKKYLREKGIEYDHTQDLCWDDRWIDIHGVKIPKAA